MYCSREYQASTRLIQQYEKSTLKPTVIMGKLVTEGEGQTDSLNHESISPTEVEDRQDTIMNREDFRIFLGQIMHTEEDQGMDKTIEVGQDMIQIIGVITDAI